MTALPRGPRSLLRALVDTYLGDPLALQLRMQRQYGDPFTAPTPLGPTVITGNPEGIKTLLTADGEVYQSAVGGTLDIFPGRGEGSLFLLAGEKHRAARKLLAPPFHGARMRAYGMLIRDIVRRWIGRWRPGETFCVLDTMQAITLDVIIQAIFGVAGSERVEQFHRQVVDSFAAFVPSIIVLKRLRRNFFPPWVRFQSRFTDLQRMIMEHAAARRADPQGHEDILSLLLQARYDDGSALSEKELFSQLLTFVFAGHETTAVSLAWALYYLHRSPESLARLRAELLPLRPALEPEAVAKLPLLEAVCNETLRLQPIIPMVRRRLARPLSLLGSELPAGTQLGIGAYLAHMRPEIFPEPLTFRPERFLSRTYSPYEYLPFGGGIRRCLGAAFALYEMKLALAITLSSCELELLETRPVPTRMRGATLGPKGGIAMRLTRAL